MTKNNFLLSIFRCLDKMSQKRKWNVFCHSSICIAETEYSNILSEEGASNKRNIFKMCISLRVLWHAEKSFTLNINERVPILPCLTKMSHCEDLTFFNVENLLFISVCTEIKRIHVLFLIVFPLHCLKKKLSESINNSENKTISDQYL